MSVIRWVVQAADLDYEFEIIIYLGRQEAFALFTHVEYNFKYNLHGEITRQ